ncbi:MAG: pantoate--beta-alanine ligase [Pseudomonadota bacterium]
MFDGISVLRSPCQLRGKVQSWRRVGERVALIPVLGPVHEGHLELVRAAHLDACRVAVCLVDLSGSPLARDLDADLSLLEAAQVDAVISPAADSYSPHGHRTRLRVGGLTDVLCGRVAQGCFDFAILMTLRLINQTQADLVLISDVQWQFCVILSQLVGDLDLDTEIRILPAPRHGDGAACSAEWHALPDEARGHAADLAQILAELAAELRCGADPAACCKNGAARFAEAGFEGIEYLELRHAGTLARVHDTVLDGPARLFGAVRLRGLRLVDNVSV